MKLRRALPVLAAWLLVAGVLSAPYLKAAWAPPPGKAFVGFFFFVDDHYLYLSYAQQAEDGAFFFQNKLVSEDHRPALVNLEWWLVGRLARGLGGRPLLAYRAFALLADLLLIAALDLWLRRLGLPPSHRLPALLLVCLGAGFGGLLERSGLLARQRCLDLATGLFPVVGLLANPHFTTGTALLLLSLHHLSREEPVPRAVGALLGSILGLVRPYDLALLAGLRGLEVVLTVRPARWLAAAAPLAALLPVALLNYWTFYRNPAFAFYAQAPYLFPAAGDLALALLPAAIAAASAWRVPAASAQARSARLCLLLWAAFGAAVTALEPVRFSLQFLVGIGAPLLLLAALGLSRWRPLASWLALAALGTTGAVAWALVMSPLPHWYADAERLAAAAQLRAWCRPGELAFAPPDVGLYLGGLSACKPYVSHVSHPDYAARAAEVSAFYGGAAPAERAALLDARCIAHLVLPGDAGEAPQAWLGPGTAFRRSALVGSAPRLASVYSRRVPGGCGADRRPGELR